MAEFTIPDNPVPGTVQYVLYRRGQDSETNVNFIVTVTEDRDMTMGDFIYRYANPAISAIRQHARERGV